MLSISLCCGRSGLLCLSYGSSLLVLVITSPWISLVLSAIFIFHLKYSQLRLMIPIFGK